MGALLKQWTQHKGFLAFPLKLKKKKKEKVKISWKKEMNKFSKLTVIIAFVTSNGCINNFYIDLINNFSNFNIFRSLSPFSLNSPHFPVFVLNCLIFRNLAIVFSLSCHYLALVTRLNLVCFCLVLPGCFPSQNHFFPTVLFLIFLF